MVKVATKSSARSAVEAKKKTSRGRLSKSTKTAAVLKKQKKEAGSSASVESSTEEDENDEFEDDEDVSLEEESEQESSEEEEDEKRTEENGSSSTLLKECKQVFKSSDLYEVLGFEAKDSKKTGNRTRVTASQIKKAYYKLALKFHPDKQSPDCSEKSLDLTKQKFQIVGKIYAVLSDEEKRTVYDETGTVYGEDDMWSTAAAEHGNWDEYFKCLFKKVSKSDVIDFFAKYRDSDEEREDLKAYYTKFCGDFDMILEHMFSEDAVNDMDRFRGMLETMCEAGEVKKFAKFTMETKCDTDQRKQLAKSEAKEAEQIAKEMGLADDQDDLRAKILSRRQKESENFLDKLAAKYEKKEKKEKTEKKKTAKKMVTKKKTETSSEEDENEEADSEEDDEDFVPEKANKSKSPARGTRSVRLPRAKKAKTTKKAKNDEESDEKESEQEVEEEEEEEEEESQEEDSDDKYSGESSSSSGYNPHKKAKATGASASATKSRKKIKRL